MRTTAKIISFPKDESEHQKNVISWSMIHRDKYPELFLLLHIPNEGKRNAAVGKNLKQQGLKRGAPDLILQVPRGKYASLSIELKTEKGRPSREQKEFVEKLKDYHNYAAICYGWKSAVALIEWYLEGAEGNAPT